MANEKRLIDANALKDDFRRYMADRYDSERCVSEENCITCGRVCLFQRTINNAPTVDAVEVVHGRWLRIGSNGKLSGKRLWQYVCSECRTLGSPQWKCCPVCTARMDGGNEDGG